MDDPQRVAARRPGIPADLLEPFDTYTGLGYAIFPGAVDAALIDRVLEETYALTQRPADYVVRNCGRYVDPASLAHPGHADRIIDVYGASLAVRQAIFSTRVRDFLQLIFGEPAIAMQSLSFTYGSQQPIHQDTAYVVSSRPMSLCASWLALEDVHPGAGPLSYYPGSHRFEHFLFGGDSKAFVERLHGKAQHRKFLEQLHDQARQRGIEARKFLAKKGDVFIWHADLAHGGSRIEQPQQTRKSLVTHFCPLSVKPNYRSFTKTYAELLHGPGAYFTSRHYDLGKLRRDGIAPVVYDGQAGAARNSMAVQHGQGDEEVAYS